MDPDVSEALNWHGVVKREFMVCAEWMVILNDTSVQFLTVAAFIL